ncbi:unnamed protein product [Durusdinium trenchii]|uniref:Programmed cell death protein 2 C-terminal domain-containing protein n=1 Tax=Durusdinium trenchii TaxID=1381693 RepID=A0ABP0Q486_9DINO
MLYRSVLHSLGSRSQIFHSLATSALLMEDVLLGYLSKKLDEEAALDIRSSRFGGAAVWSVEPSPESLVHRKDFLTCGVCGENLVLFVQISAGYGDHQKRLLYLFGCRTSSCGIDAKAWRVLRSTGPMAEAKASQKEALTAAAGSYAIDSADWGVSDWSVPGDAALDADAEIEALLAARSNVSKEGAMPSRGKEVREQQDETSSWLGVREDPLRPLSWPCLSLSVDYEPWNSAEGSHEEELLQRYLQSELSGNEDLSSMSGPLPKELEVEAASLRQEAGDALPSSGQEAGFGDEDDDDDAEEAIRAGDKNARVDWLMRPSDQHVPSRLYMQCWHTSTSHINQYMGY